jgi:predicted peptidase
MFKLIIPLVFVMAFPAYSQSEVPPSSLEKPLATVTGQKPYTLVIHKVLRDKTVRELKMNFYLYLPEDYHKDKSKKWPLLVSLHGSYQIGSNVKKLLQEGIAPRLRTKTDFPFIVLSPQLPPGFGESWNLVIDYLKELVDIVKGHYSIDPKRISCTGFSMGGYGVWQFAVRYPDLFAALVPIAGGYRPQQRVVPENIEELKHMPVWAFHSEKDTLVAPWQTTILIDALKKIGGHPKLTVYPKAGHVYAWNKAYADTGLFAWLLKQKRP